MDGFAKWQDDVGTAIAKRMYDGITFFEKGEKEFNDIAKKSRDVLNAQVPYNDKVSEIMALEVQEAI